MPERRRESRPDAPDRRAIPRPPLWLNLLLIALGLAGVVLARYHRGHVEAEFADVITQEQRTPEEIRKMKFELAEMDLTRDALQKELDARLKFVASLKSEDFYLSIDTAQKKLRFYYGDTVLREADVTIGEQATVATPSGKTYTFIPVKGAFPIQGKSAEHHWIVPEWVYAMNKQPAPKSRQVIEGGLGKYVIFLPNGYVIHTPPSEKSPLKGPKPGSVMVADEDVLRAIWERLTPQKTQVYIF